MATQKTTRLRIPYWQKGDTDWHVQYANACLLLDALQALGALAVTTDEEPSTTLNVRVAAGTFRKSDGTLVDYAGATGQAIAASATKYLYLTDAGVLTIGASWPATTYHVPLAIVSTDATTVTGVTDKRVVAFAVGQNNNTLYLALAGGTFADTTGVVTLNTGSTNGVKLGATGNKLGFLGATPVLQQANTVDIAALLATFGLRASGGNPPLNLGTGAITCGALNIGGTVTVTDAQNVAVGTTTGTKIGTAVNQKLGLWGVTPIVQPASANQASAAALTSATLTNSTTGTPSTTVGDVGTTFAQATLNNINASLVAQINALRADVVNRDTLQAAIRTALVNAGVIKGSA